MVGVPSQSKKGWDAVPAQVKIKLPKKFQHLVELGKTDKESRKNLVRGRLIENAVKGKDGGAQCAKILRTDKELSMFVPDLQAGLVVIGELPSTYDARLKNLLSDEGKSEEGK